MPLDQQASIILESLDKSIQINWNFREVYIRAIIDGLRKIEEATR